MRTRSILLVFLCSVCCAQHNLSLWGPILFHSTTKSIFLPNQALAGTTSSDIGRLTHLAELNVAGNSIFGPLPSQLGLCTVLTSLIASNNQISGSIPTELGSLILLVTLDLSSNMFSGSIPGQLATLARLARLDVSGNTQLGGNIPYRFFSGGSPGTLRISNTQLTLPASVPQSSTAQTDFCAILGACENSGVVKCAHCTRLHRAQAKGTNLLLDSGFEGISFFTTQFFGGLGAWSTFGNGQLIVDSFAAATGFSAVFLVDFCLFGRQAGISQAFTTVPGTYELRFSYAGYTCGSGPYIVRANVRDSTTLTTLGSSAFLTNSNVFFSGRGAYSQASLFVTVSGANTEVVLFVTSADTSPGIIDDISFFLVPSPTATSSSSVTPSSTVSATPTVTQSSSTTPSVTPSVTPTKTATTTVTPTSTPTSSPSPSVTSSPSVTPSFSPTVTPTQSMTPSVSSSVTPTQTATTSVTPTSTPTSSPSLKPTVSPTVSPTQTSTSSGAPTPTSTSSPSVSMTPSSSATPTATNTPSDSPTSSPSRSSSVSVSPSNTATQTASISQTATPSASQSGTVSSTATVSGTTSASASSSTSPSMTQPSPTPSTSASESTSPTFSPSSLPSMVVNPNVPSAVSIDKITLDTNPSAGVVSALLSLSLTRSPFRPLSELHVYATSGAENHKTVLLAQVAVGSDQGALFSTTISIENVDTSSEPSGILVIGLEEQTGVESIVDHAWAALEDWTLPQMQVVRVAQSFDADDRRLFVTAVVTAEIVSTGADEQSIGTVGARLYLTRHGGDGNEVRLQLVAEVQPITGASANFDVSQVELPQASTDSADIKEPLGWLVVVFNKAFEVDGGVAARELVEDEIGLPQAVVAAVATVSVAVVASTVTATVSSSATALQAVQVGVSAQGSTGAAAASPVVMIGNLQCVAMTGSMQLPSMPQNFRSFANSMSWTNGRVGLIKDFPKTSKGGIDVAQEFRFLQSASDSGPSTSQYLDAIATGGSTATQQLYDTLAVFSALFCVSLIVTLILIRRKGKAKRIVKRLVVGVFCLAYYGLTVSAILILRTSTTNSLAILISTLIIITISLPLPVIGVALRRSFIEPPPLDPVKVASGWDWLASNEQGDENVLQAIGGGTRKGCEWYGIVGVYRRLLCAVIMALVVRWPILQCASILSVFVACLVANVYFKPFKGGLKSVDFIIEACGQIVVISCCLASLVLHLTTTSPTAQQTIGKILISLQLAIILGSLFVFVTPLISMAYRACHDKENRTDLSNPQFTPQGSAKFRAYKESPKIKRCKTENENTSSGNQDTDDVTGGSASSDLWPESRGSFALLLHQNEDDWEIIEPK